MCVTNVDRGEYVDIKSNGYKNIFSRRLTATKTIMVIIPFIQQYFSKWGGGGGLMSAWSTG